MRAKVRDTELFFDVEGASLVPDGPRMVEKPSAFLLHGGPGGDHRDRQFAECDGDHARDVSSLEANHVPTIKNAVQQLDRNGRVAARRHHHVSVS